MSKLKIVEDPESPFWVLLLWEEDLWKKVYKPLFVRKLHSLFSAKTIEEMELIFTELEEKVSKSFAVRSLSKKALLSSELLKKLREKGVSEETSQKTLTFCQKIGAIQDEDLVDSRIERELRKGHGLKYIQSKWKMEINTLDKQVEEKKAAIALLQKKGKNQKNPYLFLLRRGFCVETIREVLKDPL